jgi:hypothetical protein
VIVMPSRLIVGGGDALGDFLGVLRPFIVWTLL